MERCEILERMARTLFVTSFADACEDKDAFPDFDANGQEACSGQDWFDAVTSVTPEAADIKAREIVEDFEARNARQLEEAGDEWAAISGHRREPTEDQFGHYLVMMYLGHGVGLWDDIDEPVTGFDTGNVEFYAWDWMDAA